MLKQPKREALLKNNSGQYRYLFNWIGGGWNDIWARDLKEFKKELKRQFGNSNLQVDYNTLRKATPTQSEQWDQIGWMMYI